MTEQETVSVSKGIFVFPNNFKRSKKSSKEQILKPKKDEFSDNLWYQEYTDLWEALNNEYENLTSEMFTAMTSDLLEFVSASHRDLVAEIPTAVLLTGINMPDHEAQFINLKRQIIADITPHVAFLHSQDCINLKYLIENMIKQFIKNSTEDDDDNDDNEEYTSNFKKSDFSLPLLQSWYQYMYPVKTEKKLLVVIVPDFESFSANVLQTFILIISSYLAKLPFVFVFGIATSINTLHTSFPYHVTSKTNIKVFKCEPSTVHLNKMLEGVFLSPFCPFQLGSNVFDLFTEIFLYYDFSVWNFVQNIKYAMMEHFCNGNAMALCQVEKKDVKEILQKFTHEDFENVRHLLSFRKFVESEPYENRILLLTDDEYFKVIVFEKIVIIQRYIRRLHIFLKCLHTLVSDLPGAPLGKNYREIYAHAVRQPIAKSHEYTECLQLLNFQSKDNLYAKLVSIRDIISEYINEKTKKTQLKDFFNKICSFMDLLNTLDSNPEASEEIGIMECDNTEIGQVADRRAFKSTLFSRSQQKPKPLNKYEKIREEILYYVTKQFELFLVQPSTMPFYEIFFFDDISIKSKIIGMHRSAIHNALNDPNHYLQCNCCEISNCQTIKATMPDICIAYKLHLECGKMINLYDWLQAFLYIVDPKYSDDLDDKSNKLVDPELQYPLKYKARFTQAVAELEYLGFIKSSKRKADHVARLTWGG
ncbi:unnamed protein product [Ceutorhynchus assimilis]|uniref:Origin recognition complex subunit 3 n=1 Tax=Ceutorhynchus assimilis TaxID=467358 RepID=A0A9N9MAX2_9CUCU|nr:unnamed protein product [Ceutorhynchus assimilis]